ncbi:MAG: hypothetical protein IJR47_05285 [Clostridia bacterium]|nr:hypothetical protein [Clostridia bacterium]
MKKTKVAAALALMLAAVPAFTGCQNANGQAANIEGAVAMTAENRWQETVEVKTALNENVTVSFNAFVIGSDKDKMPVVNIAPFVIDQQTADKVLQYFSDDDKAYEANYDFTKSELQAALQAFEKRYTPEELEKLKDENPERYEWYVERLNDLKKEYEAAPETIKKKEITSKIKEFTLQNDIYKHGTMKEMDCDIVSGGMDMNFFVQGMGNSFSRLIIHKKNMSHDYSVPQTTGVKNCSMTIDEAQVQADKVISDLGLSDEYALSRKGSAYVEEHYEQTGFSFDAPGCYEFFYTRKVNDLAATHRLQKYGYGHCDDFSNNMEELRRRDAEYDEEISIAINDKGVIAFDWYSPMKQTSVETESAQLLPFEQIQEIARKELANKGAYLWDANVISHTITIEEVRLGLAKVPKKDNPQEYVLTPVWDFFGKNTVKYPGKDATGYYLNENNEYEENLYGHSFLRINAIDGSFVY